jgi:hypothetical protein
MPSSNSTTSTGIRCAIVVLKYWRHWCNFIRRRFVFGSISSTPAFYSARTKLSSIVAGWTGKIRLSFSMIFFKCSFLWYLSRPLLRFTDDFSHLSRISSQARTAETASRDIKTVRGSPFFVTSSGISIRAGCSSRKISSKSS